MAAIGLERDLHAHRVADQDRPIDQGVVEHARDVVREILDRHARGIARRRGPAVTSIMRMQPEPIGEVGAQVAPDVTVAADPVAQEHRRTRAALSPRLVEQRTAVAADATA